MSAITIEELERLHAQMIEQHGAQIASIAMMMYYFEQSAKFDTPKQRLANLQVLTQCALARMRELKLDPRLLSPALTDASRIMKTINYIVSLPE